MTGTGASTDPAVRLTRLTRSTLVALLVASLVASAASAVWWWTRPRVVEAGSAVVLVEGRSLGVQSVGGMGMGVELVLVGGRCVGTGTGDETRIVVWPAGTDVSGSGDDLIIESGGHALHLGDQVAGGTSQRTDYPEFEGRLPEVCAGYPFIQFAPD